MPIVATCVITRMPSVVVAVPTAHGRRLWRLCPDEYPSPYGMCSSSLPSGGESPCRSPRRRCRASPAPVVDPAGRARPGDAHLEVGLRIARAQCQFVPGQQAGQDRPHLVAAEGLAGAAVEAAAEPDEGVPMLAVLGPVGREPQWVESLGIGEDL